MFINDTAATIIEYIKKNYSQSINNEDMAVGAHISERNNIFMKRTISLILCLLLLILINIILYSNIAYAEDISATFGESFILKDDGTIWGCGKNSARYAFCGKGEENQHTLVNTGFDVK